MSDGKTLAGEGFHEEKYSERLRQETTYYDYRRRCWERLRGWRRA